jgi:hypothetical protein
MFCTFLTFVIIIVLEHMFLSYFFRVFFMFCTFLTFVTLVVLEHIFLSFYVMFLPGKCFECFVLDMKVYVGVE